MRYYNAIIEENLTYKRGLKKAKKMNIYYPMHQIYSKQ